MAIRITSTNKNGIQATANERAWILISQSVSQGLTGAKTWDATASKNCTYAYKLSGGGETFDRKSYIKKNILVIQKNSELKSIWFWHDFHFDPKNFLVKNI